MIKTLRQRRPTARKDHPCSLCGRTIKPGETYIRYTTVYDGLMYDWKECAHCRWLITEHHEATEDAYYTDEGYDWDTICEWQPSTIAGLRAKAMWKRRWTRRDRELYDLPGGDA